MSKFINLNDKTTVSLEAASLLRMTNSTSDKWYAVSLIAISTSGKLSYIVTKRWGRMGLQGQKKIIRYTSSKYNDAMFEYDTTLEAKEYKGYCALTAVPWWVGEDYEEALGVSVGDDIRARRGRLLTKVKATPSEWDIL